ATMATGRNTAVESCGVPTGRTLAQPASAVASRSATAAARGTRHVVITNETPAPRPGLRPAPPSVVVDDPQVQLRELLRCDRRGGGHHEVRPGLGLREGHHLADVLDVGEQRRPPVDPERDPAV